MVSHDQQNLHHHPIKKKLIKWDGEKIIMDYDPGRIMYIDILVVIIIALLMKVIYKLSYFSSE